MTIPFYFGMPDGAEAIEETFVYATDVIPTNSGREQRITVREDVLRRITFHGVEIGNRDAAGTMNALLSAPNTEITVGFWPDWFELAADLPAGSTVIPADLDMRRFEIGGLAVLWHDEGQAEAIEIADIDVGGSTITLATPTFYDHPAGSAVMPGVRGTISDATDINADGDNTVVIGTLTIDAIMLEGIESTTNGLQASIPMITVVATGDRSPTLAGGDVRMPMLTLSATGGSAGGGAAVRMPKLTLSATGTAVPGGGGGTSAPGTKPPYLGTMIDPTTGVTVRRITGDPGTVIAGSGGLVWPQIAYHNYPKDQPFSAGEAYICLKQMSNIAGAGTYVILDGTTYAFVLATTGGTSGGGEKRWHPTVADQMIGLNSNGRVVWWNPITNVTTVKVAASSLYDSHEMGPNEGNPSYDGSKLVAKARRISDSHIVARVLNVDAGTYGQVIDLTAAGMTFLDWVSISADGGYVVAEGNFGSGRQDERKIWNASTGLPVQQWTDYLGQHIDLGIDAAGNPVMCSITGQSPYTHAAFMRRLSDGLLTGLSPTNVSSFNWHVGARSYGNPTMTVSVNDRIGFTWDGMIVLVHLGTPNVNQLVCHHYNNNTDYDSAPKAVQSPSGTRVLFASNFMSSTGRPMQTFVAEGL